MAENVLSQIEMEERLKWYESRYGPYIEKRGMQNWKNLFRKPTLLEMVIFIMLIMGLYMAWAYQRDVAACTEFLKNRQDNMVIANYERMNTVPKLNFSTVEKNFNDINNAISNISMR